MYPSEQVMISRHRLHNYKYNTANEVDYNRKKDACICMRYTCKVHCKDCELEENSNVSLQNIICLASYWSATAYSKKCSGTHLIQTHLTWNFI